MEIERDIKIRVGNKFSLYNIYYHGLSQNIIIQYINDKYLFFLPCNTHPKKTLRNFENGTQCKLDYAEA
jgi:hypothetical protein